MIRLQKVPSHKLLVQRLSERRRTPLDNRTGRLERQNLALGATLAVRDDGSSVSHAATGGRGNAGDEADDGLLLVVVVLEEFGGILLGGSSNLSDHDDSVRLVIGEEDAERVDKVGAGERISSDTASVLAGAITRTWVFAPDHERLAQADGGGLVHSLVCEGTGTGDNSDATALVDEAGHNADLALAGRLCAVRLGRFKGAEAGAYNDSGAVGSDETAICQ